MWSRARTPAGRASCSTATGSRRGLVSFHEHNERRRARELADRVAAGETVALVSDAGTPGVSDPGFVLVRECLARGCRWRCCPARRRSSPPSSPPGCRPSAGASPGFLPRKEGELRAELAARRRDARRLRVAGARRSLARACSPTSTPSVRSAVCRELTKLHEEVVRGTARELAERFAEGARGEIVLVIGPAAGGRCRRRAGAGGGRGAGGGGRAPAGRGEGRVRPHRGAGEPALRRLAVFQRGGEPAGVDRGDDSRDPGSR